MGRKVRRTEGEKKEGGKEGKKDGRGKKEGRKEGRKKKVGR